MTNIIKNHFEKTTLLLPALNWQVVQRESATTSIAVVGLWLLDA